MRHAVTLSTPRSARDKAAPPAFASFDDAPIILTLDEVAHILRVGTSTIRRELHLGTFTPAPFDKRPYRWRKSDVEAHVAKLGTQASALARAARARHARRRKPRPQ